MTLPLPTTEIRKPKRFLRIAVGLLCWSYLLLVLGLIVWIRVDGDRSWPATLLIFAPRWGVLLPVPMLMLLALWGNRRMWKVLLVAIVAAIFPFMGFCVGWHRFTPKVKGGLPIRVVAFNVHHHELKQPAAVRFFNDAHADVVTVEEIPVGFNRNLFPRDVWHIVVDGELCLASRFPIMDVRPMMQGTATGCKLQTPQGQVDLIVVHLSSPHYGLRDTITGHPEGLRDLIENIQERSEESAVLHQVIGQDPNPLIIAGDFNLAFDSQLFSSGFSPLIDSFEASGFGFGWTYRNGWTDVRIDHVVSGDAFERVLCYVGPFLGSPHRPVVADLILKPRH